MAAKNLRTKFENGFVSLPFDVKEEFGRARPPVKVSINGYTYRSTVSVYGGKYFIPVRKSNQEAAGIKPGNVVTVNIVLDQEPRTVDSPPDLDEALMKAHLKAAWDKLCYTRKKEFVDVLLAAKKSETRARRVDKAVAEIRAQKK